MKRLLSLLGMLVVALSTFAQTFTVDGLTYSVLSETDKTVQVSNGKNATGDVVVPETVTYNDVEYSVTAIGYHAFYQNANITSVSLPSVTSIGDYAFYYCTSLTSVSLPAVTSIGSYAFNYCSNISSLRIGSVEQWCSVQLPSSNAYNASPLCQSSKSVDLYIGDSETPATSIEVPSTVTEIPQYAFYRTTITSVSTPAATSIGSQAFCNCTSLTSVSLPAAVTSIHNYAFSGCSKISAVNYGGTLAQWCGIKFGNGSATPFGANGNATLKICGQTVESALVIPDGVTEIGQYAFYNNNTITSVTIPGSVTTVGANAFYVSALEKIFMNGSTPATISADAFVATSLFFVGNSDVDTYKSAWTNVADRIFPQTSLETVANTTAADGKSALLSAIGGVGNEANIISLKVNGTINGYDIMLMRNKLTNLRYLDLSDATIVPEKDNYQYYTGYYTKANVLGAYSFYDVDNLRSVVLPKNITAIEAYAFGACDNLTEVTGMPECCTAIGSYAFAGGYINSKWEYPKLSKIEIGTGVTSIGRCAFVYCQSLRNISIPASVKTIGSEAFYGCSALETVNFAEGLETIDYYAFYGCSRLNELRLPASLKTIDSYAFQNCSSLEQIHIPSMLTSIGDNAFTGCTKAKDVYSYTLAPINILQNTFIYDGVTLHAPQEPEDVFWDYYNNTQWSQFTNVVPFDAKYSSWYMGEDKDLTLGDGETIPNEDGEQAEGTMQPGSGLVYEEGSYQWLDKLNLNWKEGKAPSLLDNGDMYVDELVFTLDITGGKWYFFCFPFDIDLDKAKFNGKFVWRYYDGDERAANGQGGWKNVVANEQGKKILRAYQGYIFQANQSGSVELSIINPVFTAKDKQVTIASHPSDNAQDASWNLVGNPNISYYDLSNFLDNYEKPITVWDPVNNTYTAVMPGDDDYEFHPFEAFFVQKPSDVDAIAFDNAGRETYSDTQSAANAKAKAMRRAARRINPARRLVNIAISNGMQTDKTRVVFNDEKSIDYEADCDAGKFLSTESVPQIYSLDSKQNKYSINERPNLDNTVNLGFVAPADGSYTISAQRMDMNMAVMDNETGAIYNLSDGEYEFEAKTGTHNSRFVLIPAIGTTGINELSSEGIIVETGRGGITLSGLNGRTATIYSVGGSVVATIAESGYANVGTGTYIVTVDNKSSKVVVK